MHEVRLGEPARSLVFEDLMVLEDAWERRNSLRSGDRRRATGQVPAVDPTHDAAELCHDLRQPIAVATALALAVSDQEGLTALGQSRLRQLLHQLQHQLRRDRHFRTKRCPRPRWRVRRTR